MSARDKLLLAKNDSEQTDLAPAFAARALGEAAQEAGELALKMQTAGVRTWNKIRNSPVTEADMAVDEFLRTRLQSLAPDYGWQSEESADIPARSSLRRWIVDPIDGTRSFIKREADWTIATALVENGRPIACALYAPVTRELFMAHKGGGATRNGARIEVTKIATLTGARIAGPRFSIDRLNEAGTQFEAVPRIHSLALRLARVASGEIDVALAGESARDWDLAAADLLVHEAGGALTDAEGKRLVYDRPEAEHPGLAASGMAVREELLAALGKIFAGPAKN
jgi:myo-inositol-1(or 4)-monophosphatase